MFGSGSRLPPAQVLGSPVTGANGYLYLFGSCRAAPAPAGCGNGQVFLARIPAAPASWQNPFAYQHCTGHGWSSQATAAGSLIPAGQPLGISVGDYTADGRGLVMIEQTTLAGGFQAWQASAWRRLLTGPGPQNLCRALIGHPSSAPAAAADLLLQPGKGPPVRIRLPMVSET